MADQLKKKFDDFVINFDEKHNTQTLFCSLTLKEINQHFRQPRYVEFMLGEMVKVMFTPKELKRGWVHKELATLGERTYAVVQVASLTELYHEKELLSPISVMIFQKSGMAYIHPGQTRTLLENANNDQLDVIITYYREDESDVRDVIIPKVSPEFKIKDLKLQTAIQYNMKDYSVLRTIPHVFGCKHMGESFWDSIYTYSGRTDIVYKDHLGDKKLNEKYQIEHGTKGMMITLDNDSIYVDDTRLLIKQDDMWRLNPK